MISFLKQQYQKLKSKYIYEVPFAFTMKEWEEWRASIKAKHPFQYFIRDKVGDIATDIQHKYYDIRAYVCNLIHPPHPILRKAFPPRTRWRDLSNLILELNMAIILQFKAEADEGIVDWSWNPEHVEFKAWLDRAAHWFATERPVMEKAMEDAYPELTGSAIDVFSGEAYTKEKYEQMYGEVDRISRVIEDTDTMFLKQMIEYRGVFWT